MVILPETHWRVSVDHWRHAEELGFEHAWTYDHLAWRTLRDRPWFAAIPTLTAAALATTRITVGTLVASPNFRHPLTFAKELIALDDISAGRVVAGIGAGGGGWDATMLGQQTWGAKERSERFGEFVELTDRLLRQPELSWKGSYYTVDNARTYPGCVQQPRVPFVIAATGRRGMGIAARYGDSWVTTGDHGEEVLDSEQGSRVVGRQVRMLEEACGEAGRDPAGIGRMVLSGFRLDSGLMSLEAFRDTVGQYEAVGVTDFVVHWPRDSEPYAGDLALFEKIITACASA